MTILSSETKGHIEIEVNTVTMRGSFEYTGGTNLDAEYGGSLLFEKDVDGEPGIHLVDYDGVEYLKMSVIRALRELGLIVDESFE